MAAPIGTQTRPGKFRVRYSYTWQHDVTDVEIELEMIRRGGRHWRPERKHFAGDPVIEHYKRLQLLLWPDEEIDPWTELALKSFIDERIVILMGPKDCAKTQGMAKFVLCDWWAFPDDTLWMISSTTLKGAELRIWGRIKGLYNRAKARWPKLEGKSLESAKCITNQRMENTNSIRNNDLARILDRGIVVVPCHKGGDFVGLASYIGVKAPRLRHCGDEVSVMGQGFLNAYNNFVGEAKNFKGMMSGNPTDLLDPLCRAARPVGGWEHFEDTKKTQTWRSSFYNAFVVCFDGRDTPNNISPPGTVRFRHLITPRDVANIVKTNGPDHPFTYMQAYGKPNRLLTSKRVITETLCREHRAFDKVVWRDGNRVMIYGLDPAYGGPDLCVGMPAEFGRDVEENLVLKCYPYEIVPIRANIAKEADEQIAEWIRDRLTQLSIPSMNCFYGAFGRGTLGNAFARVMGRESPVAIDEGGSPTRRPVRHDLFVTEKDGTRRLMRCDEYYDRKISELWYSTRHCIETEQLRELQEEVMDEGCIRIFRMVAGARVSVETKDELKKRMQGESPNKFDTLTFVIEGARQRGFKIARLGDGIESDADIPNWKSQLRDREKALMNKDQLNYAA